MLIFVLYNSRAMADDLLILHGARFPRCTARVDKRFEGYYSLQHVARGRVELAYDDRRFTLEPGAVWAAYPGPRVRFHAACRWWDHRYVAFAGSRAGRWSAEGLLPRDPQPEPAGGAAALLDEVLACAGEGGRWSTRKAANRLERLLIALAEERAAPDDPPPWLPPLLERLSRRPAEPVDWAAAAGRTGLGLTAFRRRFREATGLSPHAYLLQCRAAEARRLLEESDLPIKAVADRLGYADVYYFTRQFRQLCGLSPGAYRRSRLARGG